MNNNEFETMETTEVEETMDTETVDNSWDNEYIGDNTDIVETPASADKKKIDVGGVVIIVAAAVGVITAVGALGKGGKKFINFVGGKIGKKKKVDKEKEIKEDKIKAEDVEYENVEEDVTEETEE